MNIQDNFCSYELSKQLKEKGFSEKCFRYWLIYPDKNPYLINEETYTNRVLQKIENNCIKAPLYQQVLQWLREKHNIHIHISRKFQYAPYFEFKAYCNYIDNGKNEELEINQFFLFNVYPDYNTALRRAIEEALKLIK